TTEPMLREPTTLSVPSTGSSGRYGRAVGAGAGVSAPPGSGLPATVATPERGSTARWNRKPGRRSLEARPPTVRSPLSSTRNVTFSLLPRVVVTATKSSSKSTAGGSPFCPQAFHRMDQPSAVVTTGGAIFSSASASADPDHSCSGLTGVGSALGAATP